MKAIFVKIKDIDKLKGKVPSGFDSFVILATKKDVKLAGGIVRIAKKVEDVKGDDFRRVIVVINEKNTLQKHIEKIKEDLDISSATLLFDTMPAPKHLSSQGASKG